MQRVNRLRFFIIAAIACAILFCIAAFSVSWAYWLGGSGAPVEVEGESGLFYVNYPQYQGELSSTPAPNLTNGTYYLQVQKHDNLTKSDYYEFSSHTDNERKLTSVHLYAGDVLDVYCGTDKKGITKCESNVVTINGNGVNSDNQYTVPKDGYYDFYYVVTAYNDYQAGRMWIDKCESSLGSGDDTSAYTYTFKFQFSDRQNTTSTLHIKSSYTPYLYIWEDSTWYYSTKGYKTTDGTTVGVINTSGGTPRTISDANNKTIAVGTYNGTMVIFNSKEDWNTDQSANRKLSALAPDTDNYLTLKTGNQNELAKDEITTATEAVPFIKNGPTSFSGGSGGNDTTPMGAMPVREVVAETTGSGDTYRYHNYICVSRVNATDAGSIAYLEFAVAGLNSTNLSEVNVKSITITRQDVYENDEGDHKAGELKDGESSRMSPRIYGIENVNTMADINSEEELKDPSNPFMIDHVKNGIYCMLYFSDDDKYYAMDITITTESSAEFTLVATAYNVNRWERYLDGFGQPYGFYLGGVINGVSTWDPDFVSNMEGTVITGPSDPNMSEEKSIGVDSYDSDYGKMFRHPEYIDLCLNMKLTKDSEVRLYMVGENGNREPQEYGGTTYAEQTVYFIPKNLTFEIMDEDGNLQVVDDLAEYYRERGYVLKNLNGQAINKDGGVAATAADQVGCEYATLLKDDAYGKRMTCDFNLIIPETGQYTIKFYGAVTYKTNGKERFNIIDNDISTAYSSDTYKYYYVQNKNCYVENARIIFKSQSNVKHMVSYVSANGEGGGPILGYAVEHKALTIPMPRNESGTVLNIGTEVNGYKVEGYYTDRECTNAFDFNNANIRQNTIIYVNWEAVAPTLYTITFKGNGGAWGAVTTKTVTTLESGKLDDIPAQPTYSGHKFTGWKDGDGNSIAHANLGSTTFSKNTTLTAQWEALPVITFMGNGGMWGAVNTKTATVQENGKIATTNIPAQPTYSGHSLTGWKDDDGKIIAHADLGSTTFSKNTTLTAQWEALPAECTITFDANGGTCSTASKETVNGKLASLPTATKDLHILDGWYTSDGEKVSTTTTFTSDQTVTARWTATKFRIVLDVSGWSGTTGYSYHIHAWNGSDTVTGTSGNEWNTRNELTRISGTNQYYIDFDSSATVIAEMIFTQDNLGTRTEHDRKQLKTSDISSNGKFELGNTYTVDTIEVKESASAIGSSGVWLVGEGLSNGGWNNGIEIPNGGAVIVKVTSAGGWLKIRNGGTGDGTGTNNCTGNLEKSGDNFVVTKGAGYYKFTWSSSTVKAEYIGTSL